MGADLIGHLVFGPRTLPEDNKPELVEAGRNVVAAVNDVLYREEPTEADDKLLRQLGLGWAEEPELEAIAELDPVQVVYNLYEFWNGGARDAVSRELPGDPERIVVFAGDMSWGDEPDGFGYATLRDAGYLGLFDLLGID